MESIAQCTATQKPSQTSVLQNLEEKKLSCAEKKNPAKQTDREQPSPIAGEAVSWEDGNLPSQAQEWDAG